MKRSEFFEEQIAYPLRQAESGTSAGRHLPPVGRQRGHVRPNLSETGASVPVGGYVIEPS